MTPPPPDDLPPRLTELLAAVPDRAFAERVRKVQQAASVAIRRLADFDLLQYETAAEIDEGPDLSLWEAMAPVLMSTIGDVNGLLQAIRTNFPPGSGGSGRALGDTQRRLREVETVIQACASTLSAQVSELGEKMRSPSVVSDRWNLLSEIQSFRSLFREGIGNLVFDTASALGEVTREQVVPGHADEIAAEVRVRATVADLVRVVQARRDRVSNSAEEDVQWNAQQLEKELDTFGRTPAYRSLRAQDKRRILELRSELGRLAARANLSKRDLLAHLHPLLEFVGALQEVRRQELLAEHDREVLATCGVMLEQVDRMASSDAAGALRTFLDAVVRAQALYGRDSELDGFLRRARKAGFDPRERSALTTELEHFRALLVNLSFA